MQEGIITKIESKFLIIKTDDADIERIKYRAHVKVGDKITYSKKDIYHGFNRLSYKQVGASLSLLIMMAIVGSIFFNNFSNSRVYGVVSFDVNPSIQVQINKNNQIIKITHNNDDSILPENYQAMNLEAFITALIDNSKAQNLLKNNETVLITYIPIVESDATSQILDDVQNKYQSYNIIVISKDESYIEAAAESNLSVGRYYLSQQLDLLDLSIEDSKTYIQDAYELINEIKPEIFDIKEQPSNDEGSQSQDISDKEELVSTSREDTDQDTSKNDEQAALEAQQKAEAEKKAAEEKQEAEAAAAKAAEEKKAQIEEQEKIVDQSYTTYLALNKASEDWHAKVKDKEVEISDQEALLASQKGKYQDHLNGQEDLISEEKTLTEKIEVIKVNEINQANQVKEDAISLFDEDKKNRDQLRIDADALNGQALSQIEVPQAVALQEIATYKGRYQEDINALQTSVTADHSKEIENLQNQIIELDNYKIIIENLSASIFNASYEFLGDYNTAYELYDQSKKEVDALLLEADNYQRKIDSGIASAESNYKSSLKLIEEKYARDQQRLGEVKDLLAGLSLVNDKFIDNIKTIEGQIVALESELTQVNTSYNDAKVKEDKAYRDYLNAKEKLEEIKGQ